VRHERFLEQLERTGRHEEDLINVRKVQFLHVLLMEDGSEPQRVRFAAAGRERLRRVLKAFDCDPLPEKVQQERAEAATHVEHRLPFGSDQLPALEAVCPA
jgi:hypothetical protein